MGIRNRIRRLFSWKLVHRDDYTQLMRNASVRFIVKVRSQDETGRYGEFHDAFNVSPHQAYLLALYSSHEDLECFQPLNFGGTQIKFGVVING